MITEDEALWAGIAVAVMMLGGGFSMLFLHTFTGYGAIVLALGLMTMALTLQSRARPSKRVDAFTRARVSTPTQPIETPTQTAEAPTPYEPSKEEATQPEQNKPSETTEPSGHVEPAPTPYEPAPSPEPPANEPLPPAQPQVPAEEKVEPQKPEEKPKEEPLIVDAAN